MKRRQVLLGSAVVFTGAAGCSSHSARTNPSTTTKTPSEGRTTTRTQAAAETTTPSQTPERKTPPADFTQKWTFDEKDDWTEQRRLTEYPDLDDAVDWTPDYARSATYSHVSSREELAGAVDAANVPSVIHALLSKWALPSEFSGTPVDIVADVRGWFMNQFNTLHFDFGSPENIEPSMSELDSGRVIGLDRYELKGDTGQLDHPFKAIIDGEDVKVKRVSYKAEGRLFGLIGLKEQIAFLAGGGWPATNAVTLQTVENGGATVSASVGDESWGIKDHLIKVLEDVDQS